MKKIQGSYAYVMLVSDIIKFNWSHSYVVLYYLDLTIKNKEKQKE